MSDDRWSALKDYEVEGVFLGTFEDAFRQYPSLLRKHMVRHGLTQSEDASLDRSRWFPLDRWIALEHALAAEVGPNTAYTVGKKIPEFAKLPPDVQDLKAVLGAIDVAYHLAHRRKGDGRLFDVATGTMLEGIGHYRFEPSSNAGEVRVVCDDPYPCDVDRGLIGGFSARFEPLAIVTHEAGSCRKNGDASCTYLVTW
jgi:hypothetical protein